MVENYYKILEIPTNATLDEIKKAFKKRAKELHPDRNKAADAHDKFVFLSEAYEYLIHFKSERVNTIPTYTQEDWQQKQRNIVRQRAKQYAQMKYEEYLKSDTYKVISSFEIVFNHLYFIFGIATPILLPLFVTMRFGWKGFFYSLLLLLLISPVLLHAIRDTPTLNFKKFWKSFLFISSSKRLRISFFILINSFIFLRIILQSLISIYFYSFLLIGLVVISLIIIRFLINPNNSFKNYFISFCILPFCFNCFFILNYVLSSNAITEQYAFYKVIQKNRETTFITLENNKYSEYPGIRIFYDYDKMKDKYYITYTFKEGLFGIKVMTDYTFNRYQKKSIIKNGFLYYTF